jgi:MFS family permease
VLGALWTRLGEASGAFALNIRSRDLRRAQLSFGAGWAAEWAFTVGLSVVAFRDGGAAAVGLVALVRLAPSALAGPFAATLADRYRRDLIIIWIGLVRAAAIGLAAVLLALDVTPISIYLLAVAATAAGTPFRAAHSALLPSLCRTPEEFTSANVVRGMLDSLGLLLGPLVAAVLLAVGGPTEVFWVAAGASLWSAILMTGIRYEAAPRPIASPRRHNLLRETGDGLRAIASSPDVALLIGLGVAQTLMRGCLMVFSVVVAIDLLRMGEAGVGVLNAAVGAGAVLGSLGASLLVGSRRFGAWFGLSVALWGAPFALIGAFPSEAPAIGLLACVGAGNALLDVAFFSLMGRLVPDEVLARVYGVLEGLIAVAVGVGAVATPAVIDWLGVRGALVALGSLCPALAILAWPRLRKLDRTMVVREREIELLRRVPMLRPLPVVTIEQLARHVRHTSVAAGETLCEQGAPGDVFYVIEAGEAEVIGNGALLRTLGPGDFFGEIALLRDTPRTATVRALTPLSASLLTRNLFVPLVSGYDASAREADAAIEGRLTRFRPIGMAA